MGHPLRFGIAGLGNAGHQVPSYFGKMPDVKLTAVADIRRDALAAFAAKYRDVRAFRSVEEMCRSEEVDAVWVATPNEFHAEHTIAAAEYGKHIICEKPMALSLEECDRMIAAADENGVKLLIGHSKISDPPVAKIREVVKSGRLGRLIQISTWNYKGWLQSPRLAAEVDTARGGGVLYRQGPHQIDIVRYIGGGMVRSVRGTAGRWNPYFDTEGNFTAFLQLDDGIPATLVFNGYGYFDMTELTWGIGEGGEQVSGRHKEREWQKGPVDPADRYAMPLRSETRQTEGKRRQPFYGLTLVSCEKGDIRQSPEGLYIYTEQGREEVLCRPDLGRGTELMKLYEAVTEARPPFPDGCWGKATLEVVLALLRSSSERREVYLSHQVPSGP